MRSRILHHLEAILKTGSIAEASRQYFIAQPSLSQFVKRLEEEHRITIFDRSQSPWVLTPEGRYFLKGELTQSDASASSILRIFREERLANC